MTTREDKGLFSRCRRASSTSGVKRLPPTSALTRPCARSAAHAYLSLLGKQGLKDVASLCFNKAHYAKERLKAVPGVKVMESSPTFNEFTVRLPVDAAEVAGGMIELGFAPGFPLGRYYPDMDNYLLVAVTERRTKYEIGSFAETLEHVLKHKR